MAIYKQSGSSNWWISIYMGMNVPRKYVPTGTDDADKARAIEANIKAAMKGNIPRDKLINAIDAIMGWDKKHGIPIADLYETYVKTNPKIGAHGLKQKKIWSGHFSTWMADNYPSTAELHEVTPQHAIAFSDWVLDTWGGRGKTQNTRMAHLKTIFTAVSIRAGFDRNPFKMVDKADQADSVHGRPFSGEEQRAIFKQCVRAGNDWLSVCTLAKFSGMRLKDIALLRWDQICDGFIDVTPAKTKKHDIRVRVPIHPEVAKELALLTRTGEYVFAVLALRYQAKEPDSKFMDEVLNHIEIDREDAHITFHCFRHTFRTMMAEADVPKDIAMKLGGWTNESTAEIYNHFEDYEKLSGAINRLK